MKLLVLGGTRFLGRHLVGTALERGHDVTLVNRNRAGNPFSSETRLVRMDRDPEVGGSPALLARESWDAVIDLSGHVPRVVRAWCEALAQRTACYLFVSSISAYADVSVSGITEAAPLAELDDPDLEDVTIAYGPLKAACERVVLDVFGERALIVRPGLIGGPFDPSDRFLYWAARFGAPHRMGLRGREVLMPAPSRQPLQGIDARDLAAWLVHCIETGMRGAFNATSPAGWWNFTALAEAGVELARERAIDLEVVWVDGALLEREGVVPWTGLPLWLAPGDPHALGMRSVDTSRAVAAGLTVRGLLDSLRDTVDWLTGSAPPGRFKTVLSAEEESRLIKSYG